ncbi:GtrA family protein [Phaeovulum vinaykumarii]|uniref:GtrA-like protein n=1 Tax=Phaeovulum vinaykumarii TaxID=407234 RepID=A0A1N7JUA3_9RHOB|nr:GtrA family protein [Phaeovulum vinaykumarii]SIS52929.1 GtrA-like protein [Phaeovulum vinaykumarii]SOB91431.1 GtrA-like protein [Phaeovulum vinaykumarii]
MTGARTFLRSFLRFGGLSGAGWLVDFTLLIVLVRAGVAPVAANFVSSATAAAGVFVLSRHLVFAAEHGGLAWRLLAYLLYTAGVITAASLAIGPVMAALGAAAGGLGVDLSPGALAALAKVVITPPQLLLNFLVARIMAQWPLKGVR